MIHAPRPSTRAYILHYWGSVTRPVIRGRLRLSKRFDRRGSNLRQLKRAATTIMTPFSPIAMADCYLSQEVAVHQLEYINPSAVNLARTQGELRGAKIVFVQVDQLSEFEATHLNRFSSPFVLITAKWHLPLLETSDTVLRIAESPLVLAWYARNFESKSPAIKPFPLGVDYWSAPKILKFREKYLTLSRERELYIPLARVHRHLTGMPLKIREDLSSHAEGEVSLKTYVRNLASSGYVICPPGEKPDTYRKWESLALGATPVTVQSRFLSALLGPHAVQVPDLASVAEGLTTLPKPRKKSGDEIWRFDYWKDKLLAEFGTIRVIDSED
jgi:hypothetical protein